MIVDKLLDDSRGGAGLLDAAGDCGLMTSPLNLAYFYGSSPPAAAPGACDPSCLSSGPSAPGSPGSDSSDFSSASSASSCGAVESRPRGGARAERLQGTYGDPSLLGSPAGRAAPGPPRCEVPGLAAKRAIIQACHLLIYSFTYLFLSEGGGKWFTVQLLTHAYGLSSPHDSYARPPAFASLCAAHSM